MKLNTTLFVSLLEIIILTQIHQVISAKSDPKPATKETNVRPIHVAVVSGCDSHLSSFTPLAYSLLHHPSVPNKYRVTFVTGSQCKHVPDNLGADFHDTGHWWYPNTEPNPPFLDLARNLSYG